MRTARSPAAPFPTRCSLPLVCRPVGQAARALASGCRRRRLSRPGLDLSARRRRHAPRLWRLVPAGSWQPPSPRHRVPAPPAGAPRTATPRSRQAHGPQDTWPALTKRPRHLNPPCSSERHQGVRLCPASSGRLRRAPPSDRPGGHGSSTPPSSPSLKGRRYVHGQACACPAADVVAFLAHGLREGAGRLVIMGEGPRYLAAMAFQAFLAHGAAPRPHGERLPAEAPERNPAQGSGVA